MFLPLLTQECSIVEFKTHRSLSLFRVYNLEGIVPEKRLDPHALQAESGRHRARWNAHRKYIDSVIESVNL